MARDRTYEQRRCTTNHHYEEKEVLYSLFCLKNASRPAASYFLPKQNCVIQDVSIEWRSILGQPHYGTRFGACSYLAVKIWIALCVCVYETQDLDAQ